MKKYLKNVKMQALIGMEKVMKHKFLEDLGIDINDDTKELLQQFDLNGFMDQISDNRLTEVKEKVDKIENENEKKDEK